MPQIATVTIELAKDVEEFLQEQVCSGVGADASELANGLIRSVIEQRQKPFDVTPELEAWLLQSADQTVTPLTRMDFDSLGQRVRARLTSAAS